MIDTQPQHITAWQEHMSTADLRRRSRLSYVPPSALGSLEATAADLSDVALCDLLAGLPLTEAGRDALFILLGSGEVIK